MKILEYRNQKRRNSRVLEISGRLLNLVAIYWFLRVTCVIGGGITVWRIILIRDTTAFEAEGRLAKIAIVALIAGGISPVRWAREAFSGLGILFFAFAWTLLFRQIDRGYAPQFFETSLPGFAAVLLRVAICVLTIRTKAPTADPAAGYSIWPHVASLLLFAVGIAGVMCWEIPGDVAKGERTSADIRWFSFYLEEYKEEHGAYPGPDLRHAIDALRDDGKGEAMNERCHMLVADSDGWGQPFRYEIHDRGQGALISCSESSKARYHYGQLSRALR